jgi:putative (di)nucleoside polyphosphate hydrolase
MMIINDKGQIFLGQRLDSKYEAWQMPQGGIDTAETPSSAVKREMLEELGCDSGDIIAETKRWYSYNIPEFLVPKLWDGKYKGQKQKWFLLRFTGKDSDINIDTETPEFKEWRWAEIAELPELIVPFKKVLYDAVLKEFQPLIIDLISSKV